MIVRSRAVPRPTDTRNPARPGPRAGRCSRRSRQIAVALLDQLRGRPPAEHGYGPGNLVNLLRLLWGDLRGLDLSDLRIRQAFLQEVEAQDASLARAHLSEALLVDAFSYPTCVALSADGWSPPAMKRSGARSSLRKSTRREDDGLGRAVARHSVSFLSAAAVPVR